MICTCVPYKQGKVSGSGWATNLVGKEALSLIISKWYSCVAHGKGINETDDNFLLRCQGK